MRFFFFFGRRQDKRGCGDRFPSSSVWLGLVAVAVCSPRTYSKSEARGREDRAGVPGCCPPAPRPKGAGWGRGTGRRRESQAPPSAPATCPCGLRSLPRGTRPHRSPAQHSQLLHMLTPELRGLKGPPAAIRRDPKPERQNRHPRSSGRCTRRFELSPGTDPPDEGAGRTGARKPSRAAGQGRRPCDGPSPRVSAQGLRLSSEGSSGGVLYLPAGGPSLQRLESRCLRAAVLHLLFSHARGLAAGGPGTRVGIAPPP